MYPPGVLGEWAERLLDEKPEPDGGVQAVAMLSGEPRSVHAGGGWKKCQSRMLEQVEASGGGFLRGDSRVAAGHRTNRRFTMVVEVDHWP